MSSWSACRVEIVTFRDGSVFEDDDVDLRIDDSGVEIAFWDDTGALVFSGAPSSDGHYTLVCRSRPRRATLHGTLDSRSFEGSWSEGELRGYWRIDLPADD